MSVAVEEHISLQEGLPVEIPRRPRFTWLPAFVVCVVVASIVLVPLLATVVGGLRTNGELVTQPFSIPKALHWENYQNILAIGSPFWGALLNSLLIVVGTIALLLVASSPAAFVLARISFPGREIVYNIFLFGLLFPLTVAALPLYLTIRQLHLL